jgi:photosystem II stability/assembly factor-like uncharacterized protein
VRGWARRAAWAALGLVALGGTPAQAAPWTSGAIHGLPDPVQVLATAAAPDRAYLLARSGFGDRAAFLYVTEDQGAHWTPRQLPEAAAAIQIAIGPPELLVEIGATGTIHRSTDHGRTWMDGACCAIMVDPGNPQHVLGFEPSGALTRSVDGGLTWSPAGPSPLPEAFDDDFEFADGALWVTTSSGGVARSTDVGLTWHIVTGVPEGLIVPVEGSPGHLYVGTFRSLDGGGSWSAMGLPAGCSFDVFDPIAPLPGSTVAWTACDAPYRTADGGATWTPVTAAPPLTRSVAPLGDGIHALAFDHNGPWRVGGGEPPSYRGDAFPAITATGLVADPHAGGRAAAGSWTTTDGGAHWQVAPDRWVPFAHIGRRTLVFSRLDDPAGTRPDAGGAVTPLPAAIEAVVLDARGTRMWALAGRLLLRTGDGLRFRPVRALGLPHPHKDFENGTGIFGGVAGGRSRTVALVWSRASHDRLVISQDGGRTFRVRTPKLPPPQTAIDLRAVDALDGRLLLARDGSGALLVSRDGGRRFTVSLPATRDFVVDPSRRGVWYAARARRLYVTRDAGRTWRRLPPPPGGRIDELDAGAGRLWAITEGAISSLAIGEGPR